MCPQFTFPGYRQGFYNCFILKPILKSFKLLCSSASWSFHPPAHSKERLAGGMSCPAGTWSAGQHGVSRLSSLCLVVWGSGTAALVTSIPRPRSCLLFVKCCDECLVSIGDINQSHCLGTSSPEQRIPRKREPHCWVV